MMHGLQPEQSFLAQNGSHAGRLPPKILQFHIAASGLDLSLLLTSTSPRLFKYMTSPLPVGSMCQGTKLLKYSVGLNPPASFQDSYASACPRSLVLPFAFKSCLSTDPQHRVTDTTAVPLND